MMPEKRQGQERRRFLGGRTLTTTAITMRTTPSSSTTEGGSGGGARSTLPSKSSSPSSRRGGRSNAKEEKNDKKNRYHTRESIELSVSEPSTEGNITSGDEGDEKHGIGEEASDNSNSEEGEDEEEGEEEEEEEEEDEEEETQEQKEADDDNAEEREDDGKEGSPSDSALDKSSHQKGKNKKSSPATIGVSSRSSRGSGGGSDSPWRRISKTLKPTQTSNLTRSESLIASKALRSNEQQHHQHHQLQSQSSPSRSIGRQLRSKSLIGSAVNETRNTIGSRRPQSKDQNTGSPFTNTVAVIAKASTRNSSISTRKKTGAITSSNESRSIVKGGSSLTNASGSMTRGSRGIRDDAESVDSNTNNEADKEGIEDKGENDVKDLSTKKDECLLRQIRAAKSELVSLQRKIQKANKRVQLLEHGNDDKAGAGGQEFAKEDDEDEENQSEDAEEDSNGEAVLDSRGGRGTAVSDIDSVMSDESRSSDEETTTTLKRAHRVAQDQLQQSKDEYARVRRRIAERMWADLEIEEEMVNKGNHPELLKELNAIENRRTARASASKARKQYFRRIYTNVFEATCKAAHDQHASDQMAVRKSMIEAAQLRMNKLRQEYKKDRAAKLEYNPAGLEMEKQQLKRQRLQYADERRHSDGKYHHHIDGYVVSSRPFSPPNSYDSESGCSESDVSDCSACMYNRRKRQLMLANDASDEPSNGNRYSNNDSYGSYGSYSRQQQSIHPALLGLSDTDMELDLSFLYPDSKSQSLSTTSTRRTKNLSQHNRIGDSSDMPMDEGVDSHARASLNLGGSYKHIPGSSNRNNSHYHTSNNSSNDYSTHVRDLGKRSTSETHHRESHNFVGNGGDMEMTMMEQERSGQQMLIDKLNDEKRKNRRLHDREMQNKAQYKKHSATFKASGHQEHPPHQHRSHGHHLGRHRTHSTDTLSASVHEQHHRQQQQFREQQQQSRHQSHHERQPHPYHHQHGDRNTEPIEIESDPDDGSKFQSGARLRRLNKSVSTAVKAPIDGVANGTLQQPRFLPGFGPDGPLLATPSISSSLSAQTIPSRPHPASSSRLSSYSQQPYQEHLQQRQQTLHQPQKYPYKQEQKQYSQREADFQLQMEQQARHEQALGRAQTAAKRRHQQPMESIIMVQGTPRVTSPPEYGPYHNAVKVPVQIQQFDPHRAKRPRAPNGSHSSINHNSNRGMAMTTATSLGGGSTVAPTSPSSYSLKVKEPSLPASSLRPLALSSSLTSMVTSRSLANGANGNFVDLESTHSQDHHQPRNFVPPSVATSSSAPSHHHNTHRSNSLAPVTTIAPRPLTTPGNGSGALGRPRAGSEGGAGGRGVGGPISEIQRPPSPYRNPRGRPTNSQRQVAIQQMQATISEQLQLKAAADGGADSVNNDSSNVPNTTSASTTSAMTTVATGKSRVASPGLEISSTTSDLAPSERSELSSRHPATGVGQPSTIKPAFVAMATTSEKSAAPEKTAPVTTRGQHLATPMPSSLVDNETALETVANASSSASSSSTGSTTTSTSTVSANSATLQSPAHTSSTTLTDIL